MCQKQRNEKGIFLSILFKSQVQWHTSLIPATQEDEVEDFLSQKINLAQTKQDFVLKIFLILYIFILYITYLLLYIIYTTYNYIKIPFISEKKYNTCESH